LDLSVPFFFPSWTTHCRSFSHSLKCGAHKLLSILDYGDVVLIAEDNEDSEICTHAGVVVRGPGVTSLGQTSECPSNPPYGWNILPNPGGRDTIYKLAGNGISGGGSNVDRVEVHEGRAQDNDLFSLDANQILMFDGPGNDVYRVIGDLVDFGESVSYSDSTDSDRVIFTEQ
jgi:hypothetical protein